MNGGDLLVDTLIGHGVDLAFTVPGESFLTVLEALRQKRNSIRLITTRHESGGGFAAEAYGKLTGRPAALFVSRGPGATNAAIAIHTARQDSTPLLLFVGQVRRKARGRESFQEIDQAAMFAPVAKAVLEPEGPDEIGAVTARAIALATEGRPGPVVVVLPRDITEADVEAVAPPPSGQWRPPAIDTAALERVAQLIDAAERPVIIAGEMVAIEDAGEQLAAFAAAAGAPVFASYRRQDVLDNLDAAYAGHLEINRVAYQREAFDAADLVVAAGSRLDGITAEEGGLVRDKPLVMLYPDQTVIKRFPCDAALTGPVAASMAALADRLTAPPDRVARTAELHRAYLTLSSSGDVPVAGDVDLAQVVAEVQRMSPPDAVVLTDGGSFARWVHRFYRFRRPHTQAGPVSGAMGYAVPGAIGARLARPNAPVIAFVGDGGFMMTGQELVTAIEQRLRIIVIVCDNSAHGSILQGQWNAFGDGHEYGTQLQSPDFAALARSYGAPAWTVRETAAFAEAFRAALNEAGPSLLHLLTDPGDIVPYGAGKEAV